MLAYGLLVKLMDGIQQFVTTQQIERGFWQKYAWDILPRRPLLGYLFAGAKMNPAIEAQFCFIAFRYTLKPRVYISDSVQGFASPVTGTLHPSSIYSRDAADATADLSRAGLRRAGLLHWLFPN